MQKGQSTLLIRLMTGYSHSLYVLYELYFLMWGFFGLSTTLMVAVLLALHLNRVSPASSLAGQVTMAVFGVISSVAAGLAFFPPKRFTDRIARTRASAS